MIRINLLPVRAARKKENIRRQVSVFFLCLIFSISVMAYLTISLTQQISRVNKDIETTKVELKKYEAIVKKVNKIKKELKTLEDKMDIIVKLEQNRSGPVRFLDALTNLVEPEKMWLTGLTQNKGSMNLDGMATDNKTIADFMTNLEKSDYFKKVDLVSSKQVAGKGKGRRYKKFSVNCKVSNKMPPKKQNAS